MHNYVLRAFGVCEDNDENVDNDENGTTLHIYND